MDKQGVIAYVGANASKYRIDPAALLAVALGEGLSTAPGSVWQVPGEPLKSFGPPSWYQGGAGGTLMKLFHFGSVPDASAWSWSPAGLDYWMQQAENSAGVAGATGLGAITAIVKNFERPAAQYVGGNINNAQQAYAGMQAQIAEVTDGEGNKIVPVPSITIPTIPGVTIPAPATGSAAKQDVKLGTIGPFQVGIPSGLVLGLLGLSLLLIGALLFAFGGQFRANVNTVG